jgi:predicted amidohydrolase
LYRIGFHQFRPLFGQPEKNLNRVLRALSDVEADLIVLPELPFTGYYFRDRAELRSLAEEPRSSLLVEALVAVCRQRGCHIVTGFAERDGERLFNSSLLIGRRGIVRTYRKLHLFNMEKRWFDPGDTPLAVNRVGGVRVGMMICFDWVFPEVARALTLEGAQILCHPSNLVLDYCQKSMLTRCLENGVYAVTTNRFGADRRPHGSVRFTGRSQIVGPRGDLLFRAPSQREVVHVVEIDPSLTRDKSLTPSNHLLRDRRPEFYRRLT